jgi:hypothetical protein
MSHHPRSASWVGIPRLETHGLKTLSRLAGACLFIDSYHGSRQWAAFLRRFAASFHRGTN